MNTNESEKLSTLLEFVKANNRVCLMPDYWNCLYQMLPNTHRVGNGWQPPLPLILAAWHDTPALMKMIRLQEHIEYAAQNNALSQVDNFLRQLEEENWAHLGDF